MFSWKDFKDKKKKIAVHCKTEKEAEEFCKMMHEQGLEWNSGTSYLDCTYWDAKDTCYVLGMYNDYEYYSKKGYKIYEFEEVKKEEREMKIFTKDDLKDGMILEYNSGKRVLNMAGNFYTAPGYFNTADRTFCGMEYDTDIDKYSDNLTRCPNEEKRTIKKVYTVKKNYRGNPISLFENENLVLLWERKEPIELDDFEKEYLNRLRKTGHQLLIRDENGNLFAFGKKVTKSKKEQEEFNTRFIDKELDTFHFVKYDEPWSIEELLKNN